MREELHQSDLGKQERVVSNSLDSSNEVEPLRTARPEPRLQANFTDFSVEVPKFKCKQDPEEFLDWMHTVVHVFEYKDVQEDKKVKLLALRLRKYASLWWTKLCAKRV